MMELPVAFCERMERMLGAEYEAFYRSYEQPRTHGLRLNTRKVSEYEFVKQLPFATEKIPWANGGYYYTEEARPGKHPYHEAGLYYIQEPSAMAVAELLDPKPGEKILDLCAAPGGKSTQIADKMQGQGFLLSNEFHPGRAKILSQNMERMGVCNAVVTNESPQRLAKHFRGYFDRVLVDTPCSGEGMFRKNPSAAAEWSRANVELCAERDMEILREAALMLRPGGRLVYSTCTFAPEENEQVIERFCENNRAFQIMKTEGNPWFSNGEAAWANGSASLEDTFRLWPHKLKGEGHFIAVLQKETGEEEKVTRFQPPKIDQTALRLYMDFAKAHLKTTLSGDRVLFGDAFYLVPDGMAEMRGLKVVRPGLHVGTVKKNRFEPSHALALAIQPRDFIGRFDFAADSAEIEAYLKGQTIAASGDKGWCLVTADGYGLGLGKQSGGVIKNHYPKGLRWV